MKLGTVEATRPDDVLALIFYRDMHSETPILTDRERRLASGALGGMEKAVAHAKDVGERDHRDRIEEMRDIENKKITQKICNCSYCTAGESGADFEDPS